MQLTNVNFFQKKWYNDVCMGKTVITLLITLWAMSFFVDTSLALKTWPNEPSPIFSKTSYLLILYPLQLSEKLVFPGIRWQTWAHANRFDASNRQLLTERWHKAWHVSFFILQLLSHEQLFHFHNKLQLLSSCAYQKRTSFDTSLTLTFLTAEQAEWIAKHMPTPSIECYLCCKTFFCKN